MLWHSPINFLTAHKMMSLPSVLAWTVRLKKPNFILVCYLLPLHETDSELNIADLDFLKKYLKLSVMQNAGAEIYQDLFFKLYI